MVSYRRGPTAGTGPAPAVGVLVSNLGTPEAPTAAALRPYLREFLWDQRVIELPRLSWWLVLNLFVLPRRPKVSAALYRKVWTAEGSPLLAIGRRQAAAIGAELADLEPPVHVALGMRYGRPSIAAALRALADRGCGRILVLPLYPQYFAGTSGSTFDAVARELATWRVVPELRTVLDYHAEPGYVAALAASIREAWEREPPGERLLFSFHGIPERYAAGGDPYVERCRETARLVAAALGLAPERWLVAFQSVFGREEWVKPATGQAIADLAAAGVRRLDVVAPGFAADCLETLDEIDGLYHEQFLRQGGERCRYIPALNDRPDHVRMLAALARRNLAGWSATRGEAARAAAAAVATIG